MPWKIRITASASKDVADIKKWYKGKSIQAAENFLEELITSIDTLESDKVEHKTVHGEYKRLLLSKFPYIIYYRRNDANGTVEIVAVLHNKRDKEAITRRLYE